MTTTPRGFGLGLIADAPDVRDRLYTPPPEHTPYRYVDLSGDPAMPPIWNQGRLGSCTAHGTLAAFLFAAAKCGANDPMLSRLMCYYVTRQLEGTTGQDAGGQIRDAIKATTMGIAPEKDWPYNIAKFTEKPPAKAYTDAAANVDLDYRSVPVTLDGIQACLSEGFPVVIGITLYQSFESDAAFTTGLAPMPAAGEQIIGGHCIAIAGIGTGADWHAHHRFATAKLDPDTVYVQLRNSWGRVYENGRSGYLLMPADYVTDPQLGTDYWTVRRVS